jgi:hypothetical protein
MTEKADLLEQVQSIIERELVRLGARKKWNVYVLPLRENVSGWIGLGRLTNCGPHRVGISPTVGVRHEQIESIIKRLSEWKRPAPTISTNVGYLMPERGYIEWIFESSPFDYMAEAEKVAKTIGLHGLPFMKANSSLDTIVDDLESLLFTYKESAAYRLPAAYLVAGKRDRAIAYVQRHQESLVGNPDAADRYGRFAKALVEEAQKLADAPVFSSHRSKSRRDD